MVQLRVLTPCRNDTPCLVGQFPFGMGRTPDNGMRLQAEGVWDRHAEIRLIPADGFQLAALCQGLVTVNDHPVPQSVRLRNGDVIGLGSAKVLFALSPTRPRPLRWREILLWVFLGLLSLGQVLLVYSLPG